MLVFNCTGKLLSLYHDRQLFQKAGYFSILSCGNYINANFHNFYFFQAHQRYILKTNKMSKDVFRFLGVAVRQNLKLGCDFSVTRYFGVVIDIFGSTISWLESSLFKNALH